MGEHTPTPWRLDGRAVTDGSRHKITITRTVESGLTFYSQGKFESVKISHEEAEANAAFIVRACNSHDALVKALESSQRIIERDYPNGQLAIDIRAALAAARGEA